MIGCIKEGRISLLMVYNEFIRWSVSIGEKYNQNKLRDIAIIGEKVFMSGMITIARGKGFNRGGIVKLQGSSGSIIGSYLMKQ